MRARPTVPRRLVSPLPDSLTTWRVQVTAISSKMHVGSGTAKFKTTRSIMIWPMLPRVFTEGDRVVLVASKGQVAGDVDRLLHTQYVRDIIAALALLCGAQMPLVENLLQSEHREAWVIPCKVAGLDWPTVRVILSCRAMGRAMTDQTLDAARADYYKLSQASAGRVLRFWQVRQTASKDAGPVKISSPAA